MLEKVSQLLQEAASFTPKSEKEVAEFSLSFLGRKGKLNELFAAFKDVSKESKKEFGKVINTLKQNVQAKIDAYKDSFDTADTEVGIDLTRPVAWNNLGSSYL